MGENTSLQTQATAVFIGKLLGVLFQFLIPAIIVRLISQEDFGLFRQFNLVVLTFSGLVGLSYGSSLYYFYPTSESLEDKKRIVQQTQLLFFINILVFSALIFFFGDFILVKLNFSEFLSDKIYIVLYCAFMILSSSIQQLFILDKNNLMNTLYPPLEKITRFIVFVIMVLIYPTYKGLIVALVLFSCLRLLYFYYKYNSYFRQMFKPNMKLLKRQVLYSLPFGIALILNMVSGRLDKFMINQYITPSEFGVYSIAFLGIPILSQFFSSIHNVVVPELSILFSKNELAKASDLWKRTVDKTSSLTIPSVFLFWVLANEIITILYTEAYVEAANYYRIFIFMFFVSMFSHEIILRASNQTKYILLSNIIGTVLTIIIGIIIIPMFHLYGAVITALFGAITPMLISLHVERKIMSLSISNWVNWKRLLINFIICTTISIPLLFLKDHITNIFLRTFVVVLSFVIFVVFFQIKYKLFLFEKQVSKLMSKIK